MTEVTTHTHTHVCVCVCVCVCKFPAVFSELDVLKNSNCLKERT